MEKQELQVQIDQLNDKLDLLLEYVREQKQKRQVLDDLVDDLSRVGADMFKSAVAELDHQGIEIDPEDLKLLFIQFVKNIGVFNSLLANLQSANDFIRDFSPIFREMIIDLIYELQRLHENGVLDAVKTITRNMTEPMVLQRLAKLSAVIAELNPDEEMDNKSLWKLLQELKTPVVRQGLSYMLRIVKELSKNENKP